MTVEYLGVLLVVALGLMFLMNSSKPRGKSPKYRENVVSGALIKKKWGEVEQMMATDRPSSLRAAVLEADKLLNAALTTRGYSGDFVTKMRKAGKSFRNESGVWSAHKFRNRMVHEVSHDFFTSEAKHALTEYKRALVDLGVLR